LKVNYLNYIIINLAIYFLLIGEKILELKYVELILENCEVVKVDRKFIGDFHLGEINTTISRVASNSISKKVSCNEFIIQINRDMNKEEYNQCTFSQIDQKTNPIKRLMKYQDITAVEITYKNDSSEIIYLKWHIEDEYNNRFQKSKLNNCGDLYIVISEDKEFGDVYGDEINDEEKINFAWDMYKEPGN